MGLGCLAGSVAMPKVASRVQRTRKAGNRPLSGPELVVNALNGVNLRGAITREEIDSRLFTAIVCRFQRLETALGTMKASV